MYSPHAQEHDDAEVSDVACTEARRRPLLLRRRLRLDMFVPKPRATHAQTHEDAPLHAQQHDNAQSFDTVRLHSTGNYTDGTCTEA